MLLFSVTENGALRKIKNMDFNDNKVFLIDDFKTIYLWFGSKASKKKKDLSVKRVEKLKNAREKSTEIKFLNQNQEYGSFLAIMEILKKGLKTDSTIERRPELQIEFEDTLELIELGIDPDFEAEITIAAHNLAQEKKPYEDLCKKLAEIQLKLLKDKDKISEKEIQKKTDDILKSSSTYEELCWLIAELSKLLGKK